ncbi:replication initiator protein A [Acetobacter sp. KSO5]|uniref:replication initiator protein A n=1 Tax=Acetobacter sp. KSO5 TaxID=3373674 RepID=UPI00376EB636
MTALFSISRRATGVFQALPGDFPPRDVQDLMAWPFFSLAKSPRFVPIDLTMGEVSIRVEASHERGMATIWDADILIWAASQIIEARDTGLRTSPFMTATPREILTFIGRGTGARDYDRLRAGLARLQATTVRTTLRRQGGYLQAFSWLNQWKERHAAANGHAGRVEITLPEWFYAGLLEDSLVLRIDPAYFRLTGGVERWLYRLVRKHAGQQRRGWRFAFTHLHAKSATLSGFSRFTAELHDLVMRQSLPGYQLAIETGAKNGDLLVFRPRGLSTGSGGRCVKHHVPLDVSHHMPSIGMTACHQSQKGPIKIAGSTGYGNLNLESNYKESNGTDVEVPRNGGKTVGRTS